VHRVSCPDSTLVYRLVLLQRALKEEHGIQSQLDALQLKLKRLRHSGRKLDTELSKEHVKSDDAFKAYAKKTCLEFCAKARKTFPREVRDVIYTYVTGCKDVTISEPPCYKGNVYQHCYFRSQSQYHLVGSDPDNNLKHYWDAEFVSKDMVREMGEDYCRSVTFQFHDKSNLMANSGSWTSGT